MDGAQISPNPRLYPPKDGFSKKSSIFVCSFQPILRDKTKIREFDEVVRNRHCINGFTVRLLLCISCFIMSLSVYKEFASPPNHMPAQNAQTCNTWTTLIIHSGGTSNHWTWSGFESRSISTVGPSILSWKVILLRTAGLSIHQKARRQTPVPQNQTF